mgnify:CR=1 FL=1
MVKGKFKPKYLFFLMYADLWGLGDISSDRKYFKEDDVFKYEGVSETEALEYISQWEEEDLVRKRKGRVGWVVTLKGKRVYTAEYGKQTEKDFPDVPSDVKDVLTGDYKRMHRHPKFRKTRLSDGTE